MRFLPALRHGARLADGVLFAGLLFGSCTPCVCLCISSAQLCRLDHAGGANMPSHTCGSSWQADMLVIGRRGLGDVKQAALSVAGLGSVSSTCVSSAPCPVIVVPLPRVKA